MTDDTLSRRAALRQLTLKYVQHFDRAQFPPEFWTDLEAALRLPAGEGWPEIGVELPWPELPRCWTGSPVSVVWEEDGERTTRAVYTDDQVRMYARLCWETMARAAAPRHETGEG